MLLLNEDENMISSNKRLQLTLFLGESDSFEIEKFRKKFNQVQFELIKTHITLCREDEIESLEKIKANLKSLLLKPFILNLGRPVRFSEGKGLLIPIIGNASKFHKLRLKILKGVIKKPRVHEPHITIIHPRNATCTDEIYDLLQNYQFPSKVSFDSISLIEQIQDEKWSVLEVFKLEK